MTERDYKKEYQREKEQSKHIGVKVEPKLFEDFTAKAELNGTNKNALLKAFIEAYTYGDVEIRVDENKRR